MLVDRDGLWYRVLVARYGEEDGRLEDGGRSGSLWWKEVMKIRDGVGGGVGWFNECVARRVGDGESTLFWHDRWCGEVPFRERFGRLYGLALNKSIMWLPEPSGVYSVRSVYYMLTSQEVPQVTQVDDLIWHNQIFC
ncbi:uncharacterized protein [Medicago truncatula]|uniref:uncharacterized protein n=1 Tax=Medicago truncatula TaxID=3880 RepID=UPI0019675FDD|nr:uncharacterized protein LOC120577035 [Medicago truncatula]